MSASKKKSRHIENDKSFKKNKERERKEMGHKFLPITNKIWAIYSNERFTFLRRLKTLKKQFPGILVAQNMIFVYNFFIVPTVSQITI